MSRIQKYLAAFLVIGLSSVTVFKWKADSIGHNDWCAGLEKRSIGIVVAIVLLAGFMLADLLSVYPLGMGASAWAFVFAFVVFAWCLAWLFYVVVWGISSR